MGLPISDEALILIVVLFVLSGVLRRFVGSDTARVERKLAKALDYGLLSEVATAPSAQAADFVRDMLRRNGIRSTIAPTEDDATLRVLVFPADASAAAAILLREP